MEYELYIQRRSLKTTALSTTITTGLCFSTRYDYALDALCSCQFLNRLNQFTLEWYEAQGSLYKTSASRNEAWEAINAEV